MSTTETTEEVEGIAYATQSVMAAVFVTGVALSVLSMSSPQSIWFIINQLQLLMLLPLTGAFIPQDVVDYFKAMSFSNFDFDFLSVDKIPVFSHISGVFGYDHDSEYLRDIDVESGSTLVNILGLIFIYMLLVLCH
jgi:hypothetical protein